MKRGFVRQGKGGGFWFCRAWMRSRRPTGKAGWLFTAVRNSLHGRSTSQAERVMRTVNLRVDFGKWSEEGVLNAMKIRLAFYYNGYDPSRNRLKPK